MDKQSKSQANRPGTTQAQGKVLPIHMTQLHLAYAKRRGKTPTSMFVHPAISSQAKANCPGTTQAQGKVLPIHMTQLHLAYAKRRGKTPTSMFVHPAISSQAKANCPKTGASKCAHPAISSQAKATWQNMYKQVCSPCHFIPGAHVPGSMGSNGGHLPLHMGLNSPPLSSALLTQHLPLSQCSKASEKAREHAWLQIAAILENNVRSQPERWLAVSRAPALEEKVKWGTAQGSGEDSAGSARAIANP